MDIVVHTNSPEPVYEQIVRQIHEGVCSRRLEPGAPLPPVRQLAGDLDLNRNTVARAYKMLEEQGVIQTAGRKGTFVRTNASAEVTRLKSGHARRVAQRMVQTLLAEGLSREEISGVFNDALAGATKGG
ncbi:MAG TPA: GntR family transcriptional regulator [Gammaproteobacteria bacterium]|nr:GntR family transcriptional regulator [Gammaproteobacteria bacterium]